MTIRFLPLALGIALGQTIGQLIYVFIKASVDGSEQYIQWSYELARAPCVGLCVGLTTSCTYTIAMAILETKRTGSAKVKLW